MHGSGIGSEKTVNSTNATLLCTDIGLLVMLVGLTSWDVTVPSKAYDPAYMYSSESESQPPSFSICDDDDESHMLFSLLSLVCIEPPPVTHNTTP